jgi:hypothetical protein
MTGTRMLMLKSRHKDGIEKERTILRVAHGNDQFIKSIDSLLSIMKPGERLYASAGERDLQKAIRLFKERQLANDYADEPEEFYRKIETRWTGCLMDVKAQAGKIWLIDCDTHEDSERAQVEIKKVYDRPVPPYVYASKSGTHIVVQAFDRSKLSEHVRSLIHENAIMLWAFT